MNAAQQQIMAEWNQGMQQAGAELQALLQQAAAGCQSLVAQHPADMEPLTRALRAVEVQLRQLKYKGAEPVPELYDRLCSADPDGPRAEVEQALAHVRRAARAFKRWADEQWLRFESSWATEQLRVMWPHVQEVMGLPAPCQQCGAPLSRGNPRQSESITCPACRAVNQVAPHPMVEAYFRTTYFFDEAGVIDKRMTLNRFKDDWDDFRDAEHAAGRERSEAPLERLEQLERLERDHWTAHFQSRVKTQGGSAEDVERFVTERMKLEFYDSMNRNDVWRAAHGMKSLSAVLDVPAELSGVDEWGPLDPSRQPNAAEDDQVHEFLLGKALSEPERHDAMLRWLGYRDATQRAQTKATFRRYYDQYWFTAEGQLSMQRAVQRTLEEEKRFDRAAADPGLVDPIEGVSVELYGKLEASRSNASSAEFVQHLAQHQLDQQKFDRVAKAWCDRMAHDKSNAIYAEYQKGLFSQAPSTGSVSFEKFCEIQGAWNAWGKQGKDPSASLGQHFSLSATDFSSIAMSWMQKMTATPALFEKFAKLTAEAEQKYLAMG